MPIVDVGGCAVRFETWDEELPVTLLHGFTSSIEQTWVERGWVAVGQSSVFGFSMGAGVALQLAMDSPARIRRLVICGIGDAAIRGLHEPQQIKQMTEALVASDPGLSPRRSESASEWPPNAAATTSWRWPR